jgi:chemotaxis protein MotB
VSEAVQLAFRHERIVRPPDSPTSSAVHVLTPTPKSPTKVDGAKRQREQRLMGLAGKITEALRSLVQSGQVRLTQTTRGLAVEINASVLFAPGQAALQPDSIAALTAVAAVLAQVDNAIHVEGHTDNIPIGGSQYPSNWELATARASSVVRLFIAGGVNPSRIVALGYAENRPVAGNDVPEGRARNRRVTLLILGDGVDEPEPQPDVTPVATRP